MARAVWDLMDEDLVETLQMDETSDSKLWLNSLCNSLGQKNFVQILVTLWATWWARRRAMYEEEFQSPLSTYRCITRYFSEL
jgi:hypothetical protein